MKANVFESQKYALSDRLVNLRQSYVTLLTDVSQNKRINFQPIDIMHPTNGELIEVNTILNGFVWDMYEVHFPVDDIFSINDLDAIVEAIEIKKTK